MKYSDEIIIDKMGEIVDALRWNIEDIEGSLYENVRVVDYPDMFDDELEDMLKGEYPFDEDPRDFVKAFDVNLKKLMGLRAALGYEIDMPFNSENA